MWRVFVDMGPEGFVLYPPSFSSMETLDQHKGAGQADGVANPAALSLVPERVSALAGSP